MDPDRAGLHPRSSRIPDVERYVLRGGQAGYARLRVLARARRAGTVELLRRAELRPGMRCLDLGCANVEFRAANVNDWDEPAAYDFVYCRFLLEHLSRPVELLRRMRNAVRPGGAVAVESTDFDGLFCDPENDGFEFHKKMFPQVVERNGGDARIGRKLYRYFLEAGIREE
jgi:ubiquinone/menaquinone biosynthesis C-methylase UbiE